MALASNRVLAIYGEFQIPCESQNRVKRINRANKQQFIDNMNSEYPGLLEKMGVYVFCIRAGRGALPWYVGKTTRPLAQEILDSDKMVKYNDILHTRTRGYPCFYFLAPMSPKGKKVSTTYLPMIEELMIATAYERNPDLANVKLTSGETWCIDGVMGGEGNKRNLTEIEDEFCNIMGIKPDRRHANKT